MTFEDGGALRAAGRISAGQSPSAEVQGHSAAERKTVGGKRDVAIAAVEPVGNYAVKLASTTATTPGCSPGRYLRELGAGARRGLGAPIWRELEAKGLSRG